MINRSHSPTKIDISKLQPKSLINKKNDTQVIKSLSENKSYLKSKHAPKTSNDLKQRLREVVGGGKLRESKAMRNNNMLKELFKSNRGKSSEKKKVKQLLPHVRKRMAAMQAQIQKVNFQPYTYSSYKEKFDEKYTNLGGLGNKYFL